MKYIFLSLALTLFALPTLACKCAPPAILKDLSQLDKYTFIALVTITDDGDQQGSSTLQFTVKELFKGVSRNNIQESAKNTSCDLYIKKGQEWLVFGVLADGKLYIHPCDRNKVYRNEKGEKYGFDDENDIDPLKTLRTLYRKPLAFHKDGPRVSYYANGQKEIEENYLNGRLHGERTTWFADGKVKAKESYLNGLKHGKWELYFKNGVLMEEHFYKAGKDYNICRIYSGDSVVAGVNMKILFLEIVYDLDGKPILTRQYYRSGQIKHEDIPGKTIDYYPNGVVRFIQHWKKGKPLKQYQLYNDQGMPVPSEDWTHQKWVNEDAQGFLNALEKKK